MAIAVRSCQLRGNRGHASRRCYVIFPELCAGVDECLRLPHCWGAIVAIAGNLDHLDPPRCELLLIVVSIPVSHHLLEAAVRTCRNRARRCEAMRGVAWPSGWCDAPCCLGQVDHQSQVLAGLDHHLRGPPLWLVHGIIIARIQRRLKRHESLRTLLFRDVYACVYV